MSDKERKFSIEGENSQNYRIFLKSEEFRNAFNETLGEFEIINKDLALKLLNLINGERIEESDLKQLSNLLNFGLFRNKLVKLINNENIDDNFINFISQEIEYYPIKQTIEDLKRGVDGIIGIEVLLGTENYDVLEIGGIIYIYDNKGKILINKKFKVKSGNKEEDDISNSLLAKLGGIKIEEIVELFKTNDGDYLLKLGKFGKRYNLVSIKRGVILENVSLIFDIKIINGKTIVKYMENGTLSSVYYYCIETGEKFYEGSEIVKKFNGKKDTFLTQNEIDALHIGEGVNT